MMEWLLGAAIFSLVFGIIYVIIMKRQGKHLNWRRTWYGLSSNTSLDDASIDFLQGIFYRDVFLSIFSIAGMIYFIFIKSSIVFGPLFILISFLEIRSAIEVLKELKKRKS